VLIKQFEVTYYQDKGENPDKKKLHNDEKVLSSLAKNKKQERF